MIKNILTILIILVPAIYFGTCGKVTEMGLIIIASAITCAFLNIDKIQKFKGAGFEAEMKKAVDEAYVTIEALKELSTPLIKATMYSLNYSNRWDGINIHERHLMKDQLEGIANSFKLNDIEIGKTFDEFRHLHTWDLFEIFIRDIINKSDNRNLIQEKLQEIENRNSNKYPTKLDIERIFKELSITITDDQNILLEDYLYYLKVGKLRRTDIKEE